MDEHERLAQRFEAHRTRMRALAYRMLGSLSEADDAVQEAWLHLSRSDTSGVENLGGYLTTVVARVCLDMLRSRNSRREEPLLTHLPDPIVSGEGVLDPEHEVLLTDPQRLTLDTQGGLFVADMGNHRVLGYNTTATPRPPLTLTVNSLEDARDFNPGDGTCDIGVNTQSCTLRAAIQETSAVPTADTILVPSGAYVLTRGGANEDLGATGDLDISDPAGVIIPAPTSSSTAIAWIVSSTSCRVRTRRSVASSFSAPKRATTSPAPRSAIRGG
jgi:CSLREA domain-containing protein